MSYVQDSDRHNLYLQRLASGLLRTQVFPTLEEAYKAARLILLDAGEIRNLRQLNSVLRKVDASTVKITAAGLDEVTKELQAIAIYEASYYAALVGGYSGATLSVPGNKTITDFINQSLMSLTSGERVTAGLWGDFIGNQIASTGAIYNNAIKASFVNKESVSQAVTRMRQATQGLLRREYETLTRTGLQHYAIQARRAMADDNKDILETEFPLVTFDNRISSTCMSISARYPKGWPLNDSPIGYPPYHFNCRTSIIYLLKGQRTPSGTRSAVGGKDTETAAEAFDRRQDRTDKKVRYRGKRDSEIFDPGQVSASKTIGGWLKEQPIWFQNSTLGVKRAEAFRAGKLELKNIADIAGRPLTLDELGLIEGD